MTKLADKRVGITGTGATSAVRAPSRESGRTSLCFPANTSRLMYEITHLLIERGSRSSHARLQQRWLENFTENQGGGATEISRPGRMDRFITTNPRTNCSPAGR